MTWAYAGPGHSTLASFRSLAHHQGNKPDGNHQHYCDANPYGSHDCSTTLCTYAQVIDAQIFSRAPARSTAVGTEWEEFIGPAEDSIIQRMTLAIIDRGNLVADLLTLKDGTAVHTAQEQVFAPVRSLTFRTGVGQSVFFRVCRVPVLVAAVAIIAMLLVFRRDATQHAFLSQSMGSRRHECISEINQIDTHAATILKIGKVIVALAITASSRRYIRTSTR